MTMTINESAIPDAWLDDAAKDAIKAALAAGGDGKAIREAFVYVPDLKDPKSWRGLHHMIDENGDLVVNRDLVYRVSAILNNTEGPLPWGRAAIVAALKHIRGHYSAMNEAELA